MHVKTMSGKCVRPRVVVLKKSRTFAVWSRGDANVRRCFVVMEESDVLEMHVSCGNACCTLQCVLKLVDLEVAFFEKMRIKMHAGSYLLADFLEGYDLFGRLRNEVELTRIVFCCGSSISVEDMFCKSME